MNYSELIKRWLQSLGFQSEKQLAELIGITPQNFSNRKKKGTLTPEIVDTVSRLNPKMNLHWVLTGEGSQSVEGYGEIDFPQSQVREPNNGWVRPSEDLDLELLTGVIKGVEKYLKDKKKALAPEKKARLISLVYNYFAKTGEPVNQGTVVSYLKLVA